MNVNMSASSVQGKREYQEDRVLCIKLLMGKYALGAVFDGHVGYKASDFASKNYTDILQRHINNDKNVMEVALFNSIKELEYKYAESMGLDNNKKYKDNELADIAGTTVCIVLIDLQKSIIYTINVGDSRAIMVRNSHVYALTGDHNMENIGRNNIQKFLSDKSAYVKEGYLWIGEKNKGENGLNVTRTVGDPLFKGRFQTRVKRNEYDIIPWLPDICSYQAKSGDIIIIGSDGVWNFIDNRRVGRIAKSDVNNPARDITHASLTDGKSNDNVSAVVIKLL